MESVQAHSRPMQLVASFRQFFLKVLLDVFKLLRLVALHRSRPFYLPPVIAGQMTEDLLTQLVFGIA